MTTTNSPVNLAGLRNPQTVPLGLKLSVGKSLRLAIQKIVDELNPEKVILFCSYAYGQPTPHSDVDLLLVLKTSASLKNEAGRFLVYYYRAPFPLIF